MIPNISVITNKLADDLTRLLKEDIRQRGLVDTGKLLNSIKIRPFFNERNLSMRFELESEDYFIYLNDRYKIMDDLLNKPQTDRIISDAIDSIIEIILLNER
jgi:hypothetical protein